MIIDYSYKQTYGRWWALYSQRTHPEAKFEAIGENIFFFSHLVKLVNGTSFRYKVLHFGFVWINTLLIVIGDLVNVDTKRSYLCLTQTFIVLWMAWSVSTSTDAVASSRRRILFLKGVLYIWLDVTFLCQWTVTPTEKKAECKGSDVSLWKWCNTSSEAPWPSKLVVSPQLRSSLLLIPHSSWGDLGP